MENLKKVLLRIPKDANNSISSFPFLHFLKSVLGSETQFHVIIDEDTEDLFNLLPFEVSSYVLPKDKNNLRGVHHFSCNLHDVFNVDYFFDFENTAKSNLMGWTFKCKERYGISRGVSKFLLNKRITLKEPNTSLEELGFSYLEELTGQNFKGKKIRADKITLAEEDFLFDELIEQGEEAFEKTLSERELKIKAIEKGLGKDPYILCLINVDELKRFDKDFWVQILRTFENVNFRTCIIGSTFSSTDQEMYTQFFQSFSSKKFNSPLFCENYSDITGLLKGSKGVITNEWTAGSISSYFGVDSFVLPVDNSIIFPKTKYFTISPRYIVMNDGLPQTVIHSDEEKKISGFSELVDFIHKTWVL